MITPRPNEDHWEDFINQIKSSIPRESFNTWFQPLRLININGTELLVQVPCQFHFDWIQEHYADTINKALGNSYGKPFTLNYSILEREPNINLKKDNTVRNFVNQRASQDNSQLNPRFTFDNFIEGDCNSFARAAALAVAEMPGKTRFNPLVVYGGVGLGKTHLIQAIANFAINHKTARKAFYLSSEKFTVDFITSIKEKKTTDFSNLYRSADLLIVDDIQFFEGKERTQMEFFHTFNTLYQAGKQIVLSLDRPPVELKQIEARLISRFQWGLVTDLQPPDYETRVAILRKRTDADGIYLDDELIDFLALNISSSVRELEGGLIRLMAYASITGQDIDINLAKRILRDILRNRPVRSSVETIQEAVAKWANIPSDLIRGDSRKKQIVIARHTAIYLCSELTNLTLKSIGSHFGNRDHSTVLHSIDEAKVRIENDPKFREDIEKLKRNIELLAV